jgi:hypothetical protein
LKPVISAIERPQTNALDRTATGVDPSKTQVFIPNSFFDFVHSWILQDKNLTKVSSG